MRKRCAYCGRYFVPDRRVGSRQKSCSRLECRGKRKREAQQRWVARNGGYFRGRYEYVKEWRQERKRLEMIQDKRPPAEPVRQYVLLIPEARTGLIQDEIILRRLDGAVFAAHG